MIGNWYVFIPQNMSKHGLKLVKTKVIYYFKHDCKHCKLKIKYHSEHSEQKNNSSLKTLKTKINCNCPKLSKTILPLLETT